MLLGLHIENVAAIEALDIEFENGFNVLSGETGAGKSIIIDSINLATGARASKDSIRTGCSSLLVQALFQADGEETLLSREVYADGRSVCRINGALSTAAAVRELAPKLISIHGQHDNQQLLQSSNHLGILDRFAKISELLESYRASFSNVQELESRLKTIEENSGELERRLDMLKFQINEIDSAQLKIGEDEELSELRLKLSNAEKISAAVGACREMLYGSGGVHDLLSSASSELEAVSSFDAELSKMAESLVSAGFIVDDVAHELGRFASDIESNPAYLAEIEDRLDIISTLKRKYGSSLEEVLKYREKIGTEADDIELSGENTEGLRAELAKAREETQLLANEISEKRHAAAEKLCALIAEQLEFLDMKAVKMEVRFTPCQLNTSGGEAAEFLISANAGEEPKPLAKIASGGELSRIMLAVQTVLQGGAETLIFDEVDSGVSGRAALKIGRKLYGISQNHQVICITHLAQIASMADCHFLIEKNSDGKTVKSSVQKLSGNQRLSELARITGGVTITDLTLKNAAEMLAQAEVFKKGDEK